ncbi:MAG: hypothetical protein MZV64_23990 [Ignavibacteriales bacterium]|nr:hypothetical protein [Ignavibacteriales bacterium]
MAWLHHPFSPSPRRFWRAGLLWRALRPMGILLRYDRALVGDHPCPVYLLTLGVISVLDELTDIDTGGVLSMGLGLTFALVAILPGGSQRTWAFIPAVILLIFGTLLVPSFGLSTYVGPALLILLGGSLVFRFFRSGA